MIYFTPPPPKPRMGRWGGGGEIQQIFSSRLSHFCGRHREQLRHGFGVVPKGLLTILGSLYKEVEKTTCGNLVYRFERQIARKKNLSLQKHCILDLQCRILSHHHQFLNREGRWGTTDDFATSFLNFALFSTALWDLPNSRPVHFLMLSSHLFLCAPCLLPPFTVSCKMVLARPGERET